MNEKTLKELGFKCGLEIHQQLLTERKLFCNCPAGYRNDKPDAEIIRSMRPTLSELGEYDGTALMEFKTKKKVIYQLYRDNMCTYEMDDTPPFLINRQALDIAIKLALLLNCSIVDELHVARKQYLDGSIPTGFQRTAIVGVGGWVPYKGRKITISHTCLEEDACREVSDKGHVITWRTDRLSMPLIEVITEPELLTPTEAREVNALIGRVLKSTGLVRRGIGSVRQDVNVSITGGTRVEMKGILKTGYVKEMTAIEAFRQKHLLEIKDELGKRGFEKDTFKPVKKDITSSLNHSTVSSFINKIIDSGLNIGVVKLPGFEGLLKREIQPGRTFADEFSGRVRVIACLDTLPNIAVSDIPSLEIDKSVWLKIQKNLGCDDNDVVILTWGPESDVVTAMNEIEIRALDAFNGVPNETRQHLKDYTTTFERILPGADRMYPDTDSPPVEIPACLVSGFKKVLPKRAFEFEEKWESLGVEPTIASCVVVSVYKDMFDYLVKMQIVNPARLHMILKKASKKNEQLNTLNYDEVAAIFDSDIDLSITGDEIVMLLSESTRDTLKTNFEKLLDNKRSVTEEEISKAVIVAINGLNGADFHSDVDRLNFLTGQVMRGFNGSVDGAVVKEMVKAKL